MPYYVNKIVISEFNLRQLAGSYPRFNEEIKIVLNKILEKYGSLGDWCFTVYCNAINLTTYEYSGLDADPLVPFVSEAMNHEMVIHCSETVILDTNDIVFDMELVMSDLGLPLLTLELHELVTTYLYTFLKDVLHQILPTSVNYTETKAVFLLLTNGLLVISVE